ncbi:MAG TPA: ATP-grasp domain-containing protein [Pseudobdellovibrionaceae bacterium]|jgi:phosphoribosylaminoimidazole carboxylase PurK protein
MSQMKIGILGGGQLGRMLWEASCSLGLPPSPVYHPEVQCPAGRAHANIIQGEITEIPKLSAFFRSVDSYAIENEFLDIKSIEQAWGSSRTQPAPSLEGLRIAQDKLEQKKFFQKNGFPTSEYLEILPADLEAAEKLEQLHKKWQGFVIKKARMGYDGKGNFAAAPSEPLNFSNIKNFCQEAFASQSRVYAEKFVPFVKEVALVSCQSFAGDFGSYPLIETIQKKGVCFLAMKALHEEKNEARAREMARLIGTKLNLLGTFAVEFFITQSGELLVNEMAPRVHNSGHFTQKAAKSSQFEMHLKSYWQKQFNPQDFETAKAFAMVNFLGPEGVRGPVGRPKNPQIYWYDKEMTSPGRKLGHMIAQSGDEKALPELLEALKAAESQWQESLRP